jgi:hypothetical protein
MAGNSPKDDRKMTDEVKMFAAYKHTDGSWAVVYIGGKVFRSLFPMRAQWSGFTEEDARSYVEHNNAPGQEWFWLGAPILQLARMHGIKCKAFNHR